MRNALRALLRAPGFIHIGIAVGAAAVALTVVLVPAGRFSLREFSLWSVSFWGLAAAAAAGILAAIIYACWGSRSRRSDDAAAAIVRRASRAAVVRFVAMQSVFIAGLLLIACAAIIAFRNTMPGVFLAAAAAGCAGVLALALWFLDRSRFAALVDVAGELAVPGGWQATQVAHVHRQRVKAAVALDAETARLEERPSIASRLVPAGQSGDDRVAGRRRVQLPDFRFSPAQSVACEARLRIRGLLPIAALAVPYAIAAAIVAAIFTAPPMMPDPGPQGQSTAAAGSDGRGGAGAQTGTGGNGQGNAGNGAQTGSGGSGQGNAGNGAQTGTGGSGQSDTGNGAQKRAGGSGQGNAGNGAQTGMVGGGHGGTGTGAKTGAAGSGQGSAGTGAQAGAAGSGQGSAGIGAQAGAAGSGQGGGGTGAQAGAAGSGQGGAGTGGGARADGSGPGRGEVSSPKAFIEGRRSPDGPNDGGGEIVVRGAGSGTDAATDAATGGPPAPDSALLRGIRQTPAPLIDWPPPPASPPDSTNVPRPYQPRQTLPAWAAPLVPGSGTGRP